MGIYEKVKSYIISLRSTEHEDERYRIVNISVDELSVCCGVSKPQVYAAVKGLIKIGFIVFRKGDYTVYRADEDAEEEEISFVDIKAIIDRASSNPKVDGYTLVGLLEAARQFRARNGVDIEL